MNKKFVIINVIVTFLLGFVVHGIYSWFPCAVTSIFPVNESLYEHVKLIYLSPVISTLIVGAFFHYKINNLFYGMIISTIFNIFLFYIIYLPIYYLFGNNLVVTLILYFMTIIASGYLDYTIIQREHNKKINILAIILTIIGIIILTFFTYHPLKCDFFRNPQDNGYGIKK